MYKDLTVIVPTYNEEKNISKLVKKLKQDYTNCTVYVMDDDSKDNTKTKAIEAGAEVFDNRNVKGLTSSVVAGKTISPGLPVTREAS